MSRRRNDASPLTPPIAWLTQSSLSTDPFPSCLSERRLSAPRLFHGLDDLLLSLRTAFAFGCGYAAAGRGRSDSNSVDIADLRKAMFVDDRTLWDASSSSGSISRSSVPDPPTSLVALIVHQSSPSLHPGVSSVVRIIAFLLFRAIDPHSSRVFRMTGLSGGIVSAFGLYPRPARAVFRRSVAREYRWSVTDGRRRRRRRQRLWLFLYHNCYQVVDDSGSTTAQPFLASSSGE